MKTLIDNGGQYIISQDVWTVSLLKHKNGRDAFLILEGVGRDRGRILMRVWFEEMQDKPTFGQVIFEQFDPLNLGALIKDCEYKTWQLDRCDIPCLEGKIAKDKSRRLRYIAAVATLPKKSGASRFFSASSEASTASAALVIGEEYSPLTWSEEVIKTIMGIEYDGQMTGPARLHAEAAAELVTKAGQIRQILEGTTVAPRSWHIDPTIKPISGSVDSFTLLPAPPSDISKVMNAYKYYPAPGMVIADIQVIYNPNFNKAFVANMLRLQSLSKNPALDPSWEYENKPDCRKKAIEKLEAMAMPNQDPDYPNVKLLLAWHGTKEDFLPYICENGYVNLAKTDSGFFGKGLYTTTEVKYAYEVYFRGGLILNWVSMYSAYPVIEGDMAILEGCGNYANYDAHFAPVKLDPTDVSGVNYYPCSADRATYHEIVVFNAYQCLPRYLVKLQPSPSQQSPLLIAPADTVRVAAAVEPSPIAGYYASARNPATMFGVHQISTGNVKQDGEQQKQAASTSSSLLLQTPAFQF